MSCVNKKEEMSGSFGSVLILGQDSRPIKWPRWAVFMSVMVWFPGSPTDRGFLPDQGIITWEKV